jgi:hypothetical protein
MAPSLEVVVNRFLQKAICATNTAISLVDHSQVDIYPIVIGQDLTHKAAGVGRGPFFATLNPAPCTLHPAPCILHPTPCTLHPAPCTLHPAPCTLHPAPCTLHPAPCTLHSALYLVLLAKHCFGPHTKPLVKPRTRHLSLQSPCDCRQLFSDKSFCSKIFSLSSKEISLLCHSLCIAVVSPSHAHIQQAPYKRMRTLALLHSGAWSDVDDDPMFQTWECVSCTYCQTVLLECYMLHGLGYWSVTCYMAWVTGALHVTWLGLLERYMLHGLGYWSVTWYMAWVTGALHVTWLGLLERYMLHGLSYWSVTCYMALVTDNSALDESS